jgi:hypothetical protein
MQIYKITNLINDKIYIGKDTTDNKNYFGSGLLIKRAIKKFGIENFKKEILEECDSNQELCEREKFWIKKLDSNNLKNGYNISEGGDGGDVVSNHPNRDEILKKMSKTMKERIFTDEHKENLSKNHYSKKYRKGKTYIEMYGVEKSEEYKKKLKESRRKYKDQKERLGDKYEKYINGLKERLSGSNNPMKKNKYFWFFNQKTGKHTRIKDGDIIPEGYVRGRNRTW